MILNKLSLFFKFVKKKENDVSFWTFSCISWSSPVNGVCISYIHYIHYIIKYFTLGDNLYLWCEVFPWTNSTARHNGRVEKKLVSGPWVIFSLSKFHHKLQLLEISRQTPLRLRLSDCRAVSFSVRVLGALTVCEADTAKMLHFGQTVHQILSGLKNIRFVTPSLLTVITRPVLHSPNLYHMWLIWAWNFLLQLNFRVLLSLLCATWWCSLKSMNEDISRLCMQSRATSGWPSLKLSTHQPPTPSFTPPPPPLPIVLLLFLAGSFFSPASESEASLHHNTSHPSLPLICSSSSAGFFQLPLPIITCSW